MKLAPLDLNTVAPPQNSDGHRGVPIAGLSSPGVTNMISVAASLLDLSRPKAAKTERVAASGGRTSPSVFANGKIASPRLFGAAASLGALATVPQAMLSPPPSMPSIAPSIGPSVDIQTLCDKFNQ